MNPHDDSTSEARAPLGLTAPLPADLPQRLRERLARPLPGRHAQARFEPDMSHGRHFGPPPAEARQAAVLIGLYEAAGQWRFPLTKRPPSLPLHAGQISLPGGMIEPGEESHAAARREWQEELGVPAGDLTLLGSLTPLYVYISNCVVTPWLAVAPRRPDFRPNPHEVEDVIEASLARLFDPAAHGRHVERRGGMEWTVPHWETHGRQVWGATGMMLGELLALTAEAIVT